MLLHLNGRGWAPVWIIFKLETIIFAGFGPIVVDVNTADWISEGLLYPLSESTKDVRGFWDSEDGGGYQWQQMSGIYPICKGALVHFWIKI